MGLTRPFGDDALAHFTERVDLEVIRHRAAETPKLAKSNKVLEAAAVDAQFSQQPPSSFSARTASKFGTPPTSISGKRCIGPRSASCAIGNITRMERSFKPNGSPTSSLPGCQRGEFFKLAKSRWEIENQGFNDAENLYGMEHIQHHHPTSMLVNWLFLLLALMIERLYRLRYLHRGSHPVLAAMQLKDLLWLSLRLAGADTS